MNRSSSIERKSVNMNETCNANTCMCVRVCEDELGVKKASVTVEP